MLMTAATKSRQQDETLTKLSQRYQHVNHADDHSTTDMSLDNETSIY